jgi:exonuclease VII small subunit
MTAKALHSAERAAEQADRAALHAHEVLRKVTTRDPRTMPFADRLTRIEFEKADAAARNADTEAAAAHARVAKLRAGNGGGGKPSTKQVRLGLAAAVAAEKRAKAAAEKNRAAIDGSFAQSAAARRRLEAAERNVEKVPEDDAEAAAQAVARNRRPPAPTLAKARAKVAEAESIVEQIRTGRERLEQRQQQLEVAVANAKRQVEDAVNAVLKAECPVDRLVAEACKLTEPLVAVRIKLRHWHAFATTAEREQIETVLCERLPGMPGEYYGEHPTSKAITAATTALMADATAEVDLEI